MGVVIIPRNYWSIRLSGCFLSYMMQLALLDMAKAATGQSQSNSNDKENQKNQCTRVGHIFSQTLGNLTCCISPFTMSCRVMTPWFNYLNSLFLWIVGRLTSTFLVCWWNHSSCKMRTHFESMATIFYRCGRCNCWDLGFDNCQTDCWFCNQCCQGPNQFPPLLRW